MDGFVAEMRASIDKCRSLIIHQQIQSWNSFREKKFTRGTVFSDLFAERTDEKMSVPMFNDEREIRSIRTFRLWSVFVFFIRFYLFVSVFSLCQCMCTFHSHTFEGIWFQCAILFRIWLFLLCAAKHLKFQFIVLFDIYSLPSFFILLCLTNGTAYGTYTISISFVDFFATIWKQPTVQPHSIQYPR